VPLTSKLVGILGRLLSYYIIITIVILILIIWSQSFAVSIPSPGSWPISQSYYDMPGISSARLPSVKSRLFQHVGSAPPFWPQRRATQRRLALGITYLLMRSSARRRAVRIAVGITLDLNVCEPRTCRCGALAVARRVHSVLCASTPADGTTRHRALNDIIYRALSNTGIPATEEPVGLTRFDGKDLMTSRYSDLVCRKSF